MEIATLQAFSISFAFDYDRAIALAESVLKYAPAPNHQVAQFARCNLLHLLSSMYYATGDLRNAEQTCRETIAIAKEMGFTLRLLNAANKLIHVNNAFGRLSRSFQIIEETLLFLQDQGFQTYFATLQLDARKIELLYERNQLEEAHRLVEMVLKQKRLVEIPYLLVDSCNLQALDLLLKKDYHGAQDALNAAKALARQTYIYEGLTWRTEYLQVRLWLKSGDLVSAISWSLQQAMSSGDTLCFSTETRALGKARILLAQGANDKALSLLDRLMVSTVTDGRNGSLIEVHVVKAIALLGQGELDQAIAEMESALALAEPEGYVRTFLDEGQPIMTLLSKVAGNAASPHANYALRLLTAFKVEKGSVTAGPGISTEDRTALPPNALLIEPLSPRELEILQLLAKGMPNQEIARQLVVATGTVKAHAASIYRKLDVANRTEAVARARQLGILP